MRIIAGEFRGRTIHAPRTMRVRPTTDRTKETMFNILQNLRGFEGARVLDLFAGSGTLGLEALSRGAVHAILVDNATASIAVIRRNVAALGVEERVTLVCDSARRFLRSAGGRFDILFVDPPYAFEAEEYLALTGEIHRRGLCAEGGILMLKFSSRHQLSVPHFDLRAERRPGETTFRLYCPTQAEAGG